MSAVRKFISWQPVLTDHQAFTFQSLAREGNTMLVAYVATLEDSVRKEQGWTDTQVRSIERRLIPKSGFLRYCFRQLREQRSDIHIFCSPFQQPRLMLCLLYAAYLRTEFYIVSEPYSPEVDGYLRDTMKLAGKLKSVLRPFLYRAYVIVLRNRISSVFAISELAQEQYRVAGMPVCKIIPFGYFIPTDVETANYCEESIGCEKNILKIVFVGSLIRRKGVDLLISASRQLIARGFLLQVDLYGPGDASQMLGLDECIRYKGLIPFGQAQKVIAKYNLLVLPSRYDGWGVVVNEALCAGVPVVCSDLTGAGVMAANMGAGLTFPSGDARALELILAQLATDPPLLTSLQKACKAAAYAIQPDVAARYMHSVIRTDPDQKAKLPAPWCPIKK